MDRKKTARLALFATSFGFLYKDVLAKLVRDWWDNPNYSHGLLVVPLAAWIVWRQRDRLAALQVRPSALGGGVIVVSLMTLAAGTIGAELFMTRIALLGTLAGTVVFVWGWRHLKATGFAFLLIALAIPIPAIIFNQIAFPLQLLASRFGEFAISSCQIPVLREGNVITLATTSLEVAEACSGGLQRHPVTGIPRDPGCCLGVFHRVPDVAAMDSRGGVGADCDLRQWDPRSGHRNRGAFHRARGGRGFLPHVLRVDGLRGRRRPVAACAPFGELAWPIRSSCPARC